MFKSPSPNYILVFLVEEDIEQLNVSKSIFFLKKNHIWNMCYEVSLAVITLDTCDWQYITGFIFV